VGKKKKTKKKRTLSCLSWKEGEKPYTNWVPSKLAFRKSVYSREEEENERVYDSACPGSFGKRGKGYNEEV